MAADRRSGAVLGTAAVLSCVPVFADLLLSWRHAPFRYLASDSYTYLTVARNAARTGLVSFDGEHPTNGFHPLWQALLTLLYKACLVLGADELTFCYLVVALGAVLTALAVAILGRTIWRARGSLPAPFALLPVGLYALVLAPAWVYSQGILHSVSPSEGPLPLQGTAWSYANGMESGLALLAFAVFASIAAKGPPATARSAWLLGLAGAFVVLARLDQVFVAAAVLAFADARLLASEGRASFGRVLAAGAGLGVPVTLYLVANVLYSGLAFPVSGAAKLSFRSAWRSQLDSLSFLLTASPGVPFWLDRAFRLAQVLIPAVAAAAFLAASFRLDRTARGLRVRARSRDEFDLFLAATAAGVLALCGGVFLFTEARSYGSWSLPVPVFFVSLAALSLLPARSPARRQGPALAAIACACLAVFVTLHRQPDHHERYRRLYMRRETIAGLYGSRPPRVIEVDDGIVGFATGFHTLPGLGFAADKELYAALREGRLLSLARERGYDRIASLLYLPLSPGPEAALRALASAYRDETGEARYALEFFDPDLPFAIVRIMYPPPAGARSSPRATP